MIKFILLGTVLGLVIIKLLTSTDNYIPVKTLDNRACEIIGYPCR